MVTSQQPPRTSDLFGRKVGAGYVIDSHIGDGGMGSVYGATSALILGKRAAVKVMAPEFTSSPDFVQRFLAEGVAAGAIDDPNVIAFWGADQFQDGRLYILMPLIQGRTLESLCAEMGPMPIELTASIVLQICSGLDAAHAIPIIHRDIKTQNILISQRRGLRYHVTILDFGIAKLLVGEQGLTRTRSTLGTVGSMAPEQAQNAKDVDPRADVYSAGVVLYRMLTGRGPFQGETDVQVLMQQMERTRRYPRVREVRPDVPKEWDELIHSMLEVDRERRPSTMLEVVQRLTQPLAYRERLMRYVAPRLMRDAAQPTDKTTGAFLEDALLIRTGVPTATKRPRRSFSFPAVVVLLAVGAGLGGGITLVTAHSPRHPADDASSGSAAAQVALAGSAAAPSAPASTALPAPSAHVRVIDAGVAVTVHDANAALATHDAATAIAVAPTQAPKPPASEPPPAPTPTPPHHAVTHALPATGNGTLKVLTPGTFADVTFDGVSLGTTPVRQTDVAPGHHRLMLVGKGKSEQLDVMIQPGKTTTITRTF